MESTNPMIHCGFCDGAVAIEYWDSEWSRTADGEHVCPACEDRGAFIRCFVCEHATPTKQATGGICHACIDTEPVIPVAWPLTSAQHAARAEARGDV